MSFSYDIVRERLFGGKLKQTQVDGIEAILDEWDNQGHSDKRWLAYILATVFHETAQKMQPVKEYGGEAYLKTKKYYPYYGRDLVQTTWKKNYEKVKAFTGVDVVTHPYLIADLKVSAATAIHFMVNGYYTGKKLSDYFNDKKDDPINARRIINGTNKAQLVASYHHIFLVAI